MSWNGALEGFVKGFTTGYELIDSPEEREAKQLGLKKLRYETSDEYFERLGKLDDLVLRKGEAELSALDYENLPSTRVRKERQTDAETRRSEGLTDYTSEETRGSKLTNDERQRKADMLEQLWRRKLDKRKARGATPLDAGAGAGSEPAPGPAPGPQSAVDTGETPTVSMSTYSPPEDEAPAPDPEASGETAPAQAQAVSTEPVADRTGARADAYEYVDEQQGQVAGIRKQPLDPATRDVLQHAGQQTGIRSVVYSGGQVGKGEDGPRTGSTRHDHGMAADVRLYDAQTGRLLDMRDPEDAERMKAFGAAAVQAGATGIGAGEGYMGPSSMHIGFGKEASWGGASWIEDARLAGVEGRALMPEPGAAGSRGGRGKGGGSLIESGHEATKVGLMAIMDAAGLNQDQAVSTPESQQAIDDMLTGANAADEEQIQDLNSIIQDMAKDENLSEAEMTLYGLAIPYEYYMMAGEPEKALEAAQSILAYRQKMFAQYSALSQAAMAQGDLPEAIDLAVRAYANVPDGKEFQVREVKDAPDAPPRYEIIIKDIAGKVEDRRMIATPDEIGAAIMEVNPADFGKMIANAAAERATTSGKEGAAEGKGKGEVPSIEDREASATAIGGTEGSEGAIDRFINERPEDAASLQLEDPANRRDLANITEQVFSNNNLGADEAFEAVAQLASRAPKEGQLQKIDEDTLVVHLPGYEPFTVSTDDYAVLALIRNKLNPPPTDKDVAPSKGAERVRKAISSIGAGGPAMPVEAPARTPQAPTAPIIPEWLWQRGTGRSGPGAVDTTPRVEPRELMRRGAVQ